MSSMSVDREFEFWCAAWIGAHRELDELRLRIAVSRAGTTHVTVGASTWCVPAMSTSRRRK